MSLEREQTEDATEAQAKPARPKRSRSRRPNRSKRPNSTKTAGENRVRANRDLPPIEGLNLANCRRLARERFGISKLRPEQEEALAALIEKRDTLVVLPTGSGKSLIYQIYAMLSDGPVITLFPLIALMKDQERSLDEDAVPVVRIDSTLTVKVRAEALARIKEGGKLVILTTPETLAKTDLQEALSGQTPSLLCVDEAHCISEWGHDFRPAYLRVGIERDALNVPCVLGLTATATPRVQVDIAERLHMKDPAVIAVPPQRDNLRLSVRNTPGNLKVAAAGKLLRQLRRPGIVYCATTKTVDEVYVALRRARIPAVRYHGRMTKAERTEAQERYTKHGPRIVMVATSAFGMGIDKRDIRYILHLQVPGSIEQYIQEAGRAGRDGRTAHCILLFDESDLDIQRRLNATGQANLNQLYSIGDALVAWAESDQGVAVKDLALSAQVPLTACRALCNELEEAGLVARDKQLKLHVLVDAKTLTDTIEELTKRFATKIREDTRRLTAIADYATTTECRSVFVRRWFGEIDPPKCGQCDRCKPKQQPRAQPKAKATPADEQGDDAKKKSNRRRRRPARRRGKSNNAGTGANAQEKNQQSKTAGVSRAQGNTNNGPNRPANAGGENGAAGTGDQPKRRRPRRRRRRSGGNTAGTTSTGDGAATSAAKPADST